MVFFVMNTENMLIQRTKWQKTKYYIIPFMWNVIIGASRYRKYFSGYLELGSLGTNWDWLLMPIMFV